VTPFKWYRSNNITRIFPGFPKNSDMRFGYGKGDKVKHRLTLFHLKGKLILTGHFCC